MTQRVLPLGLAAFLMLVWLVEVVSSPPPPPPMAAPAPPAAAPANADNTAQASAAVALLLARPLFRPGRRPVSVMTAPVDDTVPRLSAIVITAAGRSAIFVDASGSASVVAAGGHVGAYTVQQIMPGTVKLLGPNGTIVAHPQFAGGTTEVSPPVIMALPAARQEDSQF